MARKTKMKKNNSQVLDGMNKILGKESASNIPSSSETVKSTDTESNPRPRRENKSTLDRDT